MHLSIQNIFNNAYHISLSTNNTFKNIGYFILQNDMITELEIDTRFLKSVRDDVIAEILRNLGTDSIKLITYPHYQDYYHNLGFKYFNSIDNNKICLIYNVF